MNFELDLVINKFKREELGTLPEHAKFPQMRSSASPFAGSKTNNNSPENDELKR
jgi:hypothetical protein